MTLTEAKHTLTSQPLKFGDIEQIRAHEMWVQTLELLDHVKTCDECEFDRREGYIIECANAPEASDDAYEEVYRILLEAQNEAMEAATA
jgi:hypothetical protein